MRHNLRGFSLIEVLGVLAIGMLIAGLFIVGFRQATASLSATSGEEMITSKLRMAREMALSQRKCVIVTFNATNLMQISTQSALSSSPTLVEEVVLPANTVFNDGVSGYTPEGLTGLANLRNSSFVYFGDGSARATVTSTNARNNVLYLTNTTSVNQTAACAITILGSTGRVRFYIFDPNQSGWY